MATKKAGLGDTQKRAMANGRREFRIIANYLDSLEDQRPKRGRPRTKATVEKRLSAIEAELDGASPVHRLALVQERMDLDDELERLSTPPPKKLEADFVRIAAKYATRKGLTYAAWRQVGVSAEVLRRAGISRARLG